MHSHIVLVGATVGTLIMRRSKNNYFRNTTQ